MSLGSLRRGILKPPSYSIFTTPRVTSRPATTAVPEVHRYGKRQAVCPRAISARALCQTRYRLFWDHGTWGKRRLPFVVAERGAYFALSDLEKVDFLLESGQRLVDFARAGVRDKFVDTAHFGAQGLQLRHIFCGDNTVF